MMDFHETFTVALDALRANKLRAMLTSLGVIIGSASIVLVVTVALTSKRFVLQQIESVGSNLVWVEMIKRRTSQPLSHELTGRHGSDSHLGSASKSRCGRARYADVGGRQRARAAGYADRCDSRLSGDSAVAGVTRQIF
jgi:hypothetical protein